MAQVKRKTLEEKRADKSTAKRSRYAEKQVKRRNEAYSQGLGNKALPSPILSLLKLFIGGK